MKQFNHEPMLIPRLAFKNIYSAGLRTWLNVVALSFAYVAIVFIQGMLNGMTHQMETANINAQYGGGQYWHTEYDPFNPLTLDDAHGGIPAELQPLVEADKALPILIRQATIYPQGRMQNILLKGIETDQTILTIPTALLALKEGSSIPALVGGRMAKTMGLNLGDDLIVRWRDANGMFDADEVKIAGVMKTNTSDIDNGQIWISIDRMRTMTAMPGEATMIVLQKDLNFSENVLGWQHRGLDFLLKELRAAMRVEAVGDSLFYIVLLLLAMLAVFDTQFFSINRRRKEMGTLMALGMTRNNLTVLFTMEGAMYAVLAAVLGAIYGSPLFIYLASNGIAMPDGLDSFGYGIGDALYPIFTFGLILKTVLIVLIITTIVSYLPTRKIAKLNPTDALRGKLT